MISFSFNLRNPFSNRWDNIFNRGVTFDKYHKAAEFEVYRDTTIVGVAFRWTIRQDHAGMGLDIGLLGYTVSAQYYDTRHWNDEAGRFYIYEKDGSSH